MTKPATTLHRAEIIRLWNEGLSGARIAAVIGATRNAVLGALHRARAEGEHIIERGKRSRTDTLYSGRRSNEINPLRNGPKPSLLPSLAASQDVPAGGVHISELAHHHCRAPMWGKDEPTTFYYCGHKAEVGCVYCAKHKAIFYIGKAAPISLKGVKL